MTAWLIATLALLPPIAVVTLADCWGRTGSRLAALQLAASLAGMALITMTFAFDEAAFIDLPLALALLSLPGMLVITLFFKRGL
jgi:multicomponent Na+:H+ antiporter subunit F